MKGKEQAGVSLACSAFLPPAACPPINNNILMQTNSDMTRFVRKLKSVIGTEYQEEFLAEQKEIAGHVIEQLPPVGKMSADVIREKIRTDTESVDRLERSMEKSLEKARKTETRNRPIQLAEKATSFLEDIDTHILLKMNDSELRRMSRQLDKLEEVIASLRENL